MKEKLPSVRNYATSSVGYELRDQFPLITRQEAQDRLKCSHHTIDKLRRDGVLYSVNSTEFEAEHNIKYPHDLKFWKRMKARGMHYAVGIRQSDVEDYWLKIRDKKINQMLRQGKLREMSQEEVDVLYHGEEVGKMRSQLAQAEEDLGIKEKPVPTVTVNDGRHSVSTELPKKPKKDYPGIGVPVKGVAPFVPSFRKAEQNEPLIIELREEEYQRIEDTVNMRLMQLETDLEFKLANEVKRSLKEVFRQDLISTRKEIVHDICKDLRNEISGLAEKSMTNFEAINHNMKKMWDTTKEFHEELDAKLSRTYVSFAEVQEKTWKHIKKAVKARTLKPKPSRVSLWRKFMTWASSPTNSTGNNTTEKVGKGKD